MTSLLAWLSGTMNINANLIYIRILSVLAPEKDLDSHLTIVPIKGAALTDSYFIEGLVLPKPFSYAGDEQQPKLIVRPKVLLLNLEVRIRVEVFLTVYFKLELKHQKENARLSVTPSSYTSFIDAEWNLFNRKLEKIFNSGCNIVLDSQVSGNCTSYN